MGDTRNMTPAEAIIDALDQVAERHRVSARSNGMLAGNSEGYRMAAAVDTGIAEALRDVATEFAAILGIERP